MSYADAGSSGVRRFEVFTGAGGRRRWNREEKAAIIAESYAGVESVCAVANRHGLRHTQLFTWRREMRRAAEAAGVTLPMAIVREPLFVPAVIEPEPITATQPAPKKQRSRRARSDAAAVELVIDGVAVKIARGADAGVIAAVIDALKTVRWSAQGPTRA
jgi:transposase